MLAVAEAELYLWFIRPPFARKKLEMAMVVNPTLGRAYRNNE
jgi:hypothetical protein